jgi:hypothetical protein
MAKPKVAPQPFASSEKVRPAQPDPTFKKMSAKKAKPSQPDMVMGTN